jgi:L-iditol 2-dehydrogenase
LYAQRLTISKSYGLGHTVNASSADPAAKVRELTEGRGADVVILAVAGNSLIKAAMDAARPGGRVMLFAQTQHSEVAIDPAAICVDEKVLLGSYSASVDLQEENVRLVFSGKIDFSRLITHRFPLHRAIEALELAAHPGPDSMKVVIQPGMEWERS